MGNALGCLQARSASDDPQRLPSLQPRPKPAKDEDRSSSDTHNTQGTRSTRATTDFGPRFALKPLTSPTSVSHPSLSGLSTVSVDPPQLTPVFVSPELPDLVEALHSVKTSDTDDGVKATPAPAATGDKGQTSSFTF